MSNDNRIFDLEERLIDFAVFVTSVKTAKQKEDKKTFLFEIPCSIFIIQYTVKLIHHFKLALMGINHPSVTDSDSFGLELYYA